MRILTHLGFFIYNMGKGTDSKIMPDLTVERIKFLGVLTDAGVKESGLSLRQHFLFRLEE